MCIRDSINGSPLVSERLSKRVWQAIKQLNYLPNTHARTLVSGRSRLLGIIVENITNPFFPELIQSFEEIAVARGYEILVSSTNSDPAVLAACARRMLERKVDGVAVMTFGEEEPVLDQLVNRGVPIVLAEFNACPLFTAIGDTVVTGPTGHNLRDLRLLISESA